MSRNHAKDEDGGYSRHVTGLGDEVSEVSKHHGELTLEHCLHFMIEFGELMKEVG